MTMSNIFSTLSKKLLEQSFEGEQNASLQLANCQYIAQMYARVESSVAVLSDLKYNKSYIYNGAAAAELGLLNEDNSAEIDSIWEEAIFARIHPEDLSEKHLLELQFFQLLKSLPVSERYNYHVISRIRMRNRVGDYVPVQHRMFYVCNSPNGSIWLALCLYNFSYTLSVPEAYEGMIVNAATGDIIRPDRQKCDDILSDREKEILKLIKKGKRSKDIAAQLSISINTVNRHRQNILEKLRVTNSLEACRVAELIKLI